MTPNDLTFCVAGITFRAIFQEIKDPRPFLENYSPFHQPHPKTSPAFIAKIGGNLVTADAEGEEIGQFDAGGEDFGVYLLPGGNYKILIREQGKGIVCAMRFNSMCTDVCITPFVQTLQSLCYSLNNALMIAFTAAGAFHNILLVHSSVTMVDGKGYMFLGKSGTGKSTHSDLWVRYISGAEILNDDNPAIALRGGKPYVCGTPWSGKRDFYRPLDVPLGALVQLEQAPHNHIWREEPLLSFATLLNSCSAMPWDKACYSAICDTLTRVVETTPVYHLQNRPEEAAVRMSHAAVTDTET